MSIADAVKLLGRLLGFFLLLGLYGQLIVGSLLALQWMSQFVRWSSDYWALNQAVAAVAGSLLVIGVNWVILNAMMDTYAEETDSGRKQG